MELIVTQGEREETVEILREDGTTRVRVGEAVYRVDTAITSDGLYSLLIAGEAPDADPRLSHFELSVHRAKDGRYEIEAGGAHPTALPVTVADPLTHLAEASKSGGPADGKLQVTAYMPGRVVTLLAAEGDQVEEGQGILVLEAMKMENEIGAEKSGTLTRVLVEVGAAVEGGDPLFEIE